MDLARLTRCLDMPVESHPLWLDGHSRLAYIRRDHEGTHLWTLDLNTKERNRINSDDSHVWTFDTLPAKEMIFFAYDNGGDECSQLYAWCTEDSEINQLTKKPQVRHLYSGISPDGYTIYYASNERDCA